MSARRFLIISWITIVSLLGASACAPGPESKSTSAVPLAATGTASNQAQSDGEVEGEIIEVTPMSDSDLAAQPTGRAEPGAGAPGAPQAQPEQSQPGAMVVYEDSAYKFKVDYQSDFVFSARSADKLAQLEPRPAASFIFMNPVAASSDVPELEPADLEIRVYAAGQAASLDSWLASNGPLVPNGSLPPKPFQTPNVSGVEVCASTLIAPGCSYFVMGNGWVYQLIPASLAGESMVDTFMLVPSATGPGSLPGVTTVQVPGMPKTGQGNNMTSIAFALGIILAFIGTGTTWAVRRQRA